jgi:hypothetical protein
MFSLKADTLCLRLKSAKIEPRLWSSSTPEACGAVLQRKKFLSATLLIIIRHLWSNKMPTYDLMPSFSAMLSMNGEVGEDCNGE